MQTRCARIVIAFAALAACSQADKKAVEKAATNAGVKIEALGHRAADKAQDVAQKTGDDAKMMAHETADEAKRVAGKTADVAEQVSDIAKNGTPTPAAPDEVRAVLTDLEASIVCDGAGTCKVSRAFFDRVKARPDVLVAQAQSEPARDGAAVGMRIRSLGDLPRKLGFETNDLLTTINGVALTGEEAMPQLMLQLGKSRYEIEFMRAGKTKSLRLDVVDVV